MDLTVKDTVSSAIILRKKTLRDLSHKIWSNPEIGFQEHLAHDIITSFLSSENFQVEREFVLKTGFRATYKNSESSADGCPNICFICEYDAACEIGHASGHNLLTTASLAAAIGLKSCVEKNLINAEVTVIGTPAELCGGGTKIDMIKHGAFKQVDAALMLSPFDKNLASPPAFCLLSVTGKAAHYSAYPWEGKNALDAAVACYNNIALLRQGLKPNWMVNGIITNGGAMPNIVPAITEMKFWLRAPSHTDLIFLQQKCAACFVAAAKATGCEAQFNFEDNIYYPMIQNKRLGDLYKNCANEVGLEMDTDESATHIGSTDMGNVSQVVPCLDSAFNIGTSAVELSETFRDDCNTERAHENTLQAATALAYSAALLCKDKEKMSSVKEEFESQKTSLRV
ncbi:DgyrCDS299 [Dimorphilus gyrociliatus]|uniref:Peptidase M20 domain-containing protein 2 n=1 Tax=Dimorphilus gyrociliatus TaxID=2664684 RepID=A0A7I8V4B0_9ANNE|nr:DgyrCDS299 [Dimorphilus gyrociliatus]